MDSMGDNMDQSNLYLKLFKLVFGSVTLFAQENELMLKVSPVNIGHPGPLYFLDHLVSRHL
jgi:transformation/transcription domain-associated protein